MRPKPPAGLIDQPENLFRRTGREAESFISSFHRQHAAQFYTCVLIIAAHLFLLSISGLERFEYIFLDYFFRQRPAVTIHPAIVYIEIAEDSIQAVGRWPWPRHYHAVVAKLLTEWKAKSIVFDVLFSEPSTAFDDGALKEAFEQSRDIYLPVVLESKGEQKLWIHSLPEFEGLARSIGHINITPDRDGTVRRIQPYVSYGNERYPHLALRVAFDYLGREFEPDKIFLPAGDDGNLLVNWAGKWHKTFKHYSYVDLIKSFEAVQNGREPIIRPEEIEGKICLIGLTAFGHADIKANPIEPSYPAIGVHANVINSVLTNQFVRAVPLRVNAFCLIGIGLLASILFVVFRNVAAFIGGLAIGLFWLLFAFIFFWQKGVWLYVMHPLSLIFSLYAFSAVFVLIIRNRERLQLFSLATRDGLTGLYVIRYFRNLMNETVTDARKQRKPLSLILIDIDHFKQVNDTYGHTVGDLVLKKVASLIQSSVRSQRDPSSVDSVARYGGEEFIVLLRNCKLHNAAFKTAERIRKKIEQEVLVWERKQIHFTISLGAATLHPDETVPDLMVQRADEALYRAKEQGRNRTCVEDSQNSE